jgi:hypothetical protein
MPTALEPGAVPKTPETEAKPLVIEHMRLLETPIGFTPAARLVVTPALRTSGLLALLPDEAAKSLLALLTYLTPNGDIHPSVPEVAAALNVSGRQAHDRLRRLAAVRWQGEPLAVEVPRETGMDAFILSPAIVANREASTLPTDAMNLPLPLPPSSREAVIAHSRSAYATPRAEAERMVAAQLGIEPEEFADTPEGEAHRRLYAYGVPREIIKQLIADYPLDRIQRQIGWLPRRHAKSPGRFLVAAIENDYAPPGQRGKENSGAPEPSMQTTPPNSNEGR